MQRSDGKIFYPVYSNDDLPLEAGRVKPVVTEVTAHFLIQDSEPFQLSVRVSSGETFSTKVTPIKNDEQAAATLKKWWKLYTDRATLRSASHGPENALNSYLTGMLAPRMKLAPPPTWKKSSQSYDYDFVIGQFSGTDSIRAAMQAETFLQVDERLEKAELVLPEGVAIPAVPVPDFPKDLPVEPIAMHVPEDCFYIRTGSFTNFLWMSRNVEFWGSQLRDVVTQRPLHLRIREKIERQLALRETALGRMFGEQAVSDVALIGADTFLQEGAALGVIFEAKRSSLLATQIVAQRNQSATENKNATQSVVMIEGREVALIATPDNTVRSFYVRDGDYHLVTNSRTIARDFIRAGQGQGTLGKLEEFKYARHLMATDVEPTAFVYLSDPFFRRLVGPHYRVEMTRRLRAMTDIEAVQYATLAATNERRPGDTITELVDSNLLPNFFLTRPDGSKTELVDGVLIDSLRGGHGRFVPIPDIDVKGITKSEQAAYETFRQQYRLLWTRMDPVAVAIHRTGVGAEREHVSFDFYISPYVQRWFGRALPFLGKPEAKRMTRHPRDLMGLEVLISAHLARMGDITAPSNDYRVFAALRDFDQEFIIKDGQVRYPTQLSEEAWYLGSTPPLHILNDVDTTPDIDGYFESTGSVFPFKKHSWGRLFNDIRVRATTRELLEGVTPRMRVVDAERPAQIRLWVNQLRGTKYESIVIAEAHLEARRSSGQVAVMLDRLSEQLGVVPKESQVTADSLLNGTLFCPLTGAFNYVDDKGISRWVSTAWKTPSINDVVEVPRDFTFPFLNWFHGLEIEFSIDATKLRTRFEITVTPDLIQY